MNLHSPPSVILDGDVWLENPLRPTDIEGDATHFDLSPVG